MKGYLWVGYYCNVRGVVIWRCLWCGRAVTVMAGLQPRCHQIGCSGGDLSKSGSEPPYHWDEILEDNIARPEGDYTHAGYY